VVWQLVQYGHLFYSLIRYSYISFQLYVLLFRYVTNISIYSLTHAILLLCLMMSARVVLNRNVANKVLLPTVKVQDLLPEYLYMLQATKKLDGAWE